MLQTPNKPSEIIDEDWSAVKISFISDVGKVAAYVLKEHHKT